MIVPGQLQLIELDVDYYSLKHSYRVRLFISASDETASYIDCYRDGTFVFNTVPTQWVSDYFQKGCSTRLRSTKLS